MIDKTKCKQHLSDAMADLYSARYCVTGDHTKAYQDMDEDTFNAIARLQDELQALISSFETQEDAVSEELETEEPSYFFNIWDDYDDESEGTHGYAEEYGDDDEEDGMEKLREDIASLVYDWVTANTDIECSLDGQDVVFPQLPHDKRERLVEQLDAAKLTYNNVPITVGSES